MKLKDILPNHPIDTIMVRTNDPYSGDTLFGYCHWTGTELVSDDGDSYYIDDEIYKYEFNEDKTFLTYWFMSNWM